MRAGWVLVSILAAVFSLFVLLPRGEPIDIADDQPESEHIRASAPQKESGAPPPCTTPEPTKAYIKARREFGNTRGMGISPTQALRDLREYFVLNRTSRDLSGRQLDLIGGDSLYGGAQLMLWSLNGDATKAYFGFAPQPNMTESEATADLLLGLGLLRNLLPDWSEDARNDWYTRQISRMNSRESSSQSIERGHLQVCTTSLKSRYFDLTIEGF